MASEFGVHPLQITAWKKAAVQSMPEVVGAQRGRSPLDQEELERRLYERIGRLETELN